MDIEESYYLDEIFGLPEIYSPLSTNASADSSLSGPSSQVISFSTTANNNIDYDHEANGTMLLSPNNNNNNNNKRVCTGGGGRSTSQAREHLMAERKRRENLAQLFISLSKVVPGLKKLDKASLLEDAANHLKELQERVGVLEEEITRTSERNNNNINNVAGGDGDGYYSNYSPSSLSEINTINDSNDNNNNRESELSIKARISGRHVLVRIHCKKQTGLMSRVPSQLEKMHLSVVDMRIMPFGVQALDITVLAQMQSEFRGTVKEIVEHLQMLLFTADL